MDQSRDLILFVDDQLVARKYFSLMFNAEYDVLTASSAAEAWSLIRQHEDRLAVIVTDQRMPNQTGADLLMAVRRCHPQIVRLLTTGYADLDEAIDAVLRGDIYAYVHKPWNVEEFGLDLRRAVALYHLQQERDSLLGLHASAQRHVLFTDRLPCYSLIAATCAGWIENAQTATLAFWSDSMRHFLRSTSRTSPTKPWGDVQEQPRRLMASATEIGTWLAKNRSTTDPVIVDAAQVAMNFAAEYGVRCAGSATAVPIPLDQRLFVSGLQSLLCFLDQAAARTGSASVSSLGLAEAACGGLDLVVRMQGQQTMSSDRSSDPITTERLGLQAYLAIHHHGGEVAVRQWTQEGGAVKIHIPTHPPSNRRTASTQIPASTHRQ